MIPGPSVDRHHWIPKSQGGRVADPVHMICHRKIHSVLDERSLAVLYDTPEKLKRHPEIARFLVWVARKPPAFTSRHRGGRRR